MPQRYEKNPNYTPSALTGTTITPSRKFPLSSVLVVTL